MKTQIPDFVSISAIIVGLLMAFSANIARFFLPHLWSQRSLSRASPIGTMVLVGSITLAGFGLPSAIVIVNNPGAAFALPGVVLVAVLYTTVQLWALARDIRFLNRIGKSDATETRRAVSE